MKTTFTVLTAAAVMFLFAGLLHAQRTVSTQDIEWTTFLKQHDLVWDSITPDYYAGAIMGNGLLGNNIYKEGDAYKFHIGRVDVTEGRMPADTSQYPNNLYHGARLPIGYFLMKPVGAVLSEEMRLNLWDATTTGMITTDKGRISFKSYVHATRDLIVLETNTKGEEHSFRWDWNALKATSPRYTLGRKDYPQEYIDNPNPDVKIYTEGEYNLSVQNLQGGKSYVVAWREVKRGDSRRIFVTISQEQTEQLAIDKAKKTIAEAAGEEAVSLEDSHRQWWHAYYPASFASFGNTKMESFYWIQQYKFGCLTRPDKYIIDLQGPWAVEKTPWPAIWMNLNVQLTYSPLFTANRAEMSKPLWKSLNDNLRNLTNNVPIDEWKKDAIAMGRSSSYHLHSKLNMTDKSIYEVGNLTWILFYYYEYCIYLGDEEELLKRFYPLLKKSIAYYAHIREKREDGKYHLPETASPEYRSAKDCNYDLSLLRWGLNTLLDINTRYKLNDAKAPEWNDFRDHLVDYPVDPEKGYMIGEGVNLTSSHRHYSHLLMVYPLYTVNWDQPENRELISKSVSHWQSMPAYLQGYSFTGSSSMYSMMGDGEKAVGQLQKLIDKFIRPNTLYLETGPVIETPLAGAASLQELFVQSWGGKIRVFPAVPADWQQSSFINFRTEGAFLISASRNKGRTVFVQIESEKGGECIVQTDMDTDQLKVEKTGGGRAIFSIVGKGVIRIKTEKGDIIQLTDKTLPAVLPHPVEHSPEEHNSYGFNR